MDSFLPARLIVEKPAEDLTIASVKGKQHNYHKITSMSAL